MATTQIINSFDDSNIIQEAEPTRSGERPSKNLALRDSEEELNDILHTLYDSKTKVISNRNRGSARRSEAQEVATRLRQVGCTLTGATLEGNRALGQSRQLIRSFGSGSFKLNKLFLQNHVTRFKQRMSLRNSKPKSQQFTFNNNNMQSNFSWFNKSNTNTHLRLTLGQPASQRKGYDDKLPFDAEEEDELWPLGLHPDGCNPGGNKLFYEQDICVIEYNDNYPYFYTSCITLKPYQSDDSQSEYSDDETEPEPTKPTYQNDVEYQGDEVAKRLTEGQTAEPTARSADGRQHTQIYDLFNRLDKFIIMELQRRTQVHTFRRNQCVYLPGDHYDTVISTLKQFNYL